MKKIRFPLEMAEGKMVKELDELQEYFDLEKALEYFQNGKLQKWLEAILKKLAEMKGADVNSFEVRELVGEYDSVTKQLFRLPDATEMALEMAAAYRTDAEIRTAQDRVYGEGTTAFIGQAIEAFYKG